METLDFRKLSTIGLILGVVATIAQVISLPLPYVIGVGAVGLIILIYAFVVRKRVSELPQISKPNSNLTKVRQVATPAEFEELNKLYHQCFGSSAVPTEVLSSWWKANPKGLLGLYKNGEITGGVSIWSIDDPTYEKILNGFIKEKEILSSNITNQGCDNFYISEIAIKRHDRNLSNLSDLLKGAIRHLQTIGCFPIKVLALGYSPKGINLMKRLGFIKQLNSDKTADKQPLFKLEIETSASMETIITELDMLKTGHEKDMINHS